MRRSIASLLLPALSCALFAQAPGQSATPKKPKLVLAIVVDQFRYDYLARFRSGYTSGFKRLLEQGAVFENAHYIHALTVTAIGHSTFLSGATPNISGIVGNDWFDRSTGKIVTSVSDPGTTTIGGTDAAGSSPRRMLTGTLGDEIKMAGGKSKVIGISIKDRSAILPAGHMADAAYWFEDKSKHWVTSDYYMSALPKWVEAVNAAAPDAKSRGAQWLALDAKTGDKPFCTMTPGGVGNGKDAIRYCGSLEASPWGNEMIEDLAEKALVAEELGKHDGTDVLAVSYSANDYVGHARGPDSPEVRDISIRTDRLLGKLIEAAEKQAGVGNVLVVLTADHGVAPVPEVNQARKMPGGRVANAQLTAAMQAALEARFGAGKWIDENAGSPYFNKELMVRYKVTSADVENVAAEAARAIPHVYRVYTANQILSGAMQADSISSSVTNNYFRGRSGDLIILLDEYYQSGTSGTTHGTPFNYDTHVPVIFLGAGIKKGHYYQRIAPNDIAPTLAAILGVQEPGGSVGRVLQELWQ
jgi:predicted AlkP superfamily pyrophosphatase or phosphodiesterase